MKKKLYRSTEDRIIAGVCAGVGEYLNVDVSIVRISTVILAVVTAFFPVAFLYLLAALVIPVAPAVRVHDAE